MKAVLISIQPKWVEKITSGEKTIEVRKTKPKLETPFKCYIYCTKDGYDVTTMGSDKPIIWHGKVIGEFVCDRIDDLRYVPTKYYLRPAGTWEEIICKSSCLSVDQIKEYAKGKAVYGWHISNLKIYNKPKELSEFKRFCDGVGGEIGCKGCEYYYLENSESGRYEECCCDNLRPLKRPFQSWGYINV